MTFLGIGAYMVSLHRTIVVNKVEAEKQIAVNKERAEKQIAVNKEKAEKKIAEAEKKIAEAEKQEDRRSRNKGSGTISHVWICGRIHSLQEETGRRLQRRRAGSQRGKRTVEHTTSKGWSFSVVLY